MYILIFRRLYAEGCRENPPWPRGLAKLWARDSALEIVRYSRTLELLMSIREKNFTQQIHCTREARVGAVPVSDTRWVVTLWPGSVCYGCSCWNLRQETAVIMYFLFAHGASGPDRLWVCTDKSSWSVSICDKNFRLKYSSSSDFSSVFCFFSPFTLLEVFKASIIYDPCVV